MGRISINIIGCGRVGKTIGYLLTKKAGCDIKGILNRSLASSKSAVEFIGGGYACQSYQELITSNLWLISAQDSLISSICKILLSHKKLSRGDIIIHFSGALSSKILHSAKEVGCLIGSLHPIRSFVDPETSVNTFEGTYCAYEGDEQAFSLMKHLCQKIGAKIFKINQEAKSLYHIGSVFASNYLVALLKVSHNFYYKSGVKEKYILDIIYSLSSGTLANIKQSHSLDRSITGPIHRGDIDVIRSHISSLESTPSLLNLYKILGNTILELVSEPNESPYARGIQELLS
ncbi:MAG: hypothetical protein PG981_001457 [Wolbachia endosymbiont of Ctenocephalides orientis wCori]|nr:MAG: hypothetical protein PG981_001457 [Wolbachia endosymbiont of Ctenocephalides orientis wCori]